MSTKNPAKKSRATKPGALEPHGVLSENAARLAHAAPTADGPSPAVKARLLARIRAAQAPVHGAAAAPAPSPGWRFDSVRDAAGWFALPAPGVRMKLLSADPARDVMQMLVEIAPGGRFPDHDHVTGDEGIVLSGDVFSGGRLLRAGDYYYAGPGTKHNDIVSPSGCTALVSFSITAWNRWKSEMMATGALT